MKQNYRAYKSFPGNIDPNHEIFYNPQIDGTPFKISVGKLLEYINDNTGLNSSPKVLWTSVDGVVIDNDTASGIGEGIGSKTVDISDIQKHTLYKIEIQGFLDTEEVPENVVLKLKLGSTELVSDTLTAINFPGLDDKPVKATYYIGINATGASGSVIASSEYHTNVYSLNITGTLTGGSSTPISVDLSSNKDIDIEVNAGVGCIWKTAIVEIQKLN